ncbi:MAG: hypothetical protein DRR08_03450 [Candidatus Parabeggiatoa sp. nov. 2]|nr:MAG: hypothetical protein DRR08_03450 [Gammaproteobacteria bacterium]
MCHSPNINNFGDGVQSFSFGRFIFRPKLYRFSDNYFQNQGKKRTKHRNPFGVGAVMPKPTGCTFTFNPFGVGAVMPKPTGCTCGYSHSTPFGVGAFYDLPQVAPVAIHIQPLSGLARFMIYHRLHLWLFFTTGCTCGYSHFQAKVSLRETLA